jgi:hypothetical protein
MAGVELLFWWARLLFDKFLSVSTRRYGQTRNFYSLLAAPRTHQKQLPGGLLGQITPDAALSRPLSPIAANFPALPSIALKMNPQHFSSPLLQSL